MKVRISSPIASIVSRLTVLVAVAALALLSLPALLAAEGQQAPIQEALTHYETIRVALLHDSTDGVATASAELLKALRSLTAEDATAADAGVAAADLERARELAPELVRQAEALAAAEELRAVRDAFYELTQPLVRYRSLMVVEAPAVAYCPMAKRSWLQPQGEIGNPYYGQSMARCGEIVES